MSWGNLSKTDDKKMNELYDKFVPGYGKADTLGGEIVRAINRLVYRYYNDGDTVDKYYGSYYNHNKACNDFLVDCCPVYIELRGIDEWNYEDRLCENLKLVLDWLVENEEKVFSIPNEIDCIENAPYEPPYNNEDEDEDDWDDYEVEDEF